MAEVQKQLAWATPPPGKVSSEVIGNDILAMMTSMVTGRAGQVKPVDIKDGEYWTKIASDGTLTKYRWTLADGDTDGTPEQTILGSITAKAGHFPLPYTDPDTGKVVFDKSWQMGGGGMPIGASIAVYCTSTYTPFGAVPQDGATYSASQFPNVVEYIEDGFIPWITPTDYEAEITAHGKCGCFAWDSTARTFRVPLMPDGTFIQQAMSDSELGKSYDAGLPNIEGDAQKIAGGYGMLDVPGGRTSGAFKNGEVVQNRTAGTSGQSAAISFDASLSNPIYGNSDTVQPSAIALRHFVVVATETDQQSVMDWSAWASALGGKANTDLSNASSTANANLGNEYRVIYGAGQRAVYAPDNHNALEDDVLGNNGVVSINSRYVLDNPFGNNTPVIVSAEVYANGVWSRTGDIYDVTGGYGTGASFVSGVGIVIQTGKSGVANTSVNTTSGHGLTYNVTSAQCRVHIWKIGG